MLLTYGRLDVSEMQGTTEADILVAVEADLRLADADRVVYEEPSFPVVELARSLLRWVNEARPGDFVFDSMSFEELGALTIRREASGWTFGSVFVSDVSPPVPWTEVEQCVRGFVQRVDNDLTAAGLDADLALRDGRDH